MGSLHEHIARSITISVLNVIYVKGAPLNESIHFMLYKFIPKIGYNPKEPYILY